MYGRSVNRLGVGIFTALLAGALSGGCGGAPEPRASAPTPVSSSVPGSARAAALTLPPLPDECEQQPGKPPPEPLERSYTGVAKSARCQGELHTIMRGVSQALGVGCNYCHLVPDYRALTHRKQIANWMASELVPALRKKSDGKTPWCSDCHATLGKGRAKLLGDPRDASFAIEWMTTHLVEDFESNSGAGLRCNGCHRGNVGTPQFQRKIMLSELSHGD